MKIFAVPQKNTNQTKMIKIKDYKNWLSKTLELKIMMTNKRSSLVACSPTLEICYPQNKISWTKFRRGWTNRAKLC